MGKYWQTKEYIDILSAYTEISTYCRLLNPFDVENLKYFKKRDKYAIELKRIKSHYESN